MMDAEVVAGHMLGPMSHIVLIVLVIRVLAIGQVLLLALVIGRGTAPRALRISATLLLMSTCAYLTLQTPLFHLLRPSIGVVITLGAQMVPLMLWLFAHRLFERRIDWRCGAGAAAVILICWAVTNIGYAQTALPLSGPLFCVILIERAVHLILLAHTMQIALAERGDDLIEKRRRLRVGFVIVIACLAVMVILFELVFGFDNMPQPAVLVQAIAILASTMALGAALLQSDTDLLFDPAAPPPRPEHDLSPSEHVLKQKLDAAMAGGVYRESGMTIGVLAERLGTPEHRLRALINQRLGYRNFSAFLNHHRIAEAKLMLADPAHVDLPILTMAMDLGYGSLAPFNRAFREEAGQAPSDYRRARIMQN